MLFGFLENALVFTLTIGVLVVGGMLMVRDVVKRIRRSPLTSEERDYDEHH